MSQGLCKARFVRQMRGDGTVDDAQRHGHDFRITGKQKSQWERHTEDPLNMTQWEFYVLLTRLLGENLGKRKTLSLSILKSMGPISVGSH